MAGVKTTLAPTGGQLCPGCIWPKCHILLLEHGMGHGAAGKMWQHWAFLLSLRLVRPPYFILNVVNWAQQLP